MLDLTKLPGITPYEGYRIDPIIQAAADLQAVGQADGLGALQSAAGELQAVGALRTTDLPHATPRELALRRYFYPAREALIVLCRMLFAFTPGGVYNRPPLGLQAFFGESDEDQWPLNPITIEGGAPFLVTFGYSIFGRDIFAWEYLVYCIERCAWSTTAFRPLAAAEKAAALEALIDSPKWKRPLQDREREALAAQCS